MNTTPCLGEEVLSRAIFAENLSDDTELHLQSCPVCRDEVELARSALRTVRSSSLSGDLVKDLVAEQSTLLSLVETSEVQSRESSAEEDPSRVGNYQLLEVLNRGGQGVVYRAWDSVLHRVVAIKLCRHAASQRRIDQIRTEGALLARIDHPALTRVFHVDLHDGRPYLVMELIEGQNLRQYIAVQNVSLGRRLKIIKEVASAVAAAHRGGVLHLDLKPENVMIDRFGRIKLVDLGMGRRFDTASERRSVVCGTFEYMAPEQLNPRSLLDIRTDVFGIGAILFFLLSERPLIQRLGRQSVEDHSELLQDAVRELHASTIDRQLRKICATALSPQQADRFPDVDTFVRAIKQFQFAKWSSKAILAMTVLLVLISCAMLSTPDQAEHQSSQVAELPVVVDVRAMCPESEKYDFYLTTSAGAVLKMQGLTDNVVNGQREYGLAGGGPLTVAKNDWIMVVAVPAGKPESTAQILQVLSVSKNGSPLKSNCFRFRITPSGGLETTFPLSNPGFLDEVAIQSRHAGLQMAGCYLATNSPTRSAVNHLQVQLELDELWNVKMY